jgi:predicted DNA-binding transcriptional regulator AlpA
MASMRAVQRGQGATVTLPDPDTVSEDAIAVLIAQLAALMARATARLVGRRPRPPDCLLDLEEAAARLRTTPDWLKRQTTLPFRVELSPGQVRFSVNGIDDWIAGRVGTA